MHRSSAIPLLAALAALGALPRCATLREDTTARSETLDYLHQRPIDEVWPAVRAVLDGHGYSIREGEQGHFLATDWKLMADSVWIAYAVEGYRQAGNTCLIRMFRIQHLAKSNARPPAEWNRVYKGLPVGLTGNPDGPEASHDPTNPDGRPELSRVNPRRPTLFEVGEGYRADRDARLEREVIERAAPVDAAKMAKLLKLRLEREEQRRAAPAPAEDEAARLCGGAVPGVETLLRPGAVVVLGEQYGTAEIPGFVGRAACLAARRGVPVRVGVEIPVVESGRLRWYLDRKAAPEGKATLMGGLFWARPHQDGRSSAAMLALIDQLAALRAAGLPVDLFPFDVHDASGNAREQSMAANVLAVRGQHPESALLVLTGNVHARTTPGVPWDQAFRPMGSFLKAQAPGAVVLDAHYAGGEAWQCKLGADGRVSCERFQVEPPVRKLPTVFMGELAPNRVTLFEGPEPDGGFQGVFYVGVLSASPPAAAASVPR